MSTIDSDANKMLAFGVKSGRHGLALSVAVVLAVPPPGAVSYYGW
jgi:hypothetical protein